MGKNDGSVKDVRYFQCGANHGVFVPRDKILQVLSTPSPDTPMTQSVPATPVHQPVKPEPTPLPAPEPVVTPAVVSADEKKADTEPPAASSIGPTTRASGWKSPGIKSLMAFKSHASHTNSDHAKHPRLSLTEHFSTTPVAVVRRSATLRAEDDLAAAQSSPVRPEASSAAQPDAASTEQPPDKPAIAPPALDFRAKIEALKARNAELQAQTSAGALGKDDLAEKASRVSSAGELSRRGSDISVSFC